MSTQPLEIRMAHLEGAYEQVSQRLGTIEARLTAFDQRFGRLEEMVDKRFDTLSEKVDQRSLWIIGLVVISILLPLAERLIR